MRSLLAHALRHRRSYLLGFVTLACVDFINSTVQPLLLGVPFKQLEKGASASIFLECGLAYVGVSLLQMLLRYLWRYFFMGSAEKVGFEIREELFKKLQRLPVAYFDRAKTGDLMSRATNDLDAVRSSLGMGALLAFDSLCYFLMVPAIMLWISPKLTLVTVACLPVVPILIYKLGGIVHVRSRVVQDVFGKLSARLQETFSGIRVVQAFAQEDRESERFEDVAREYLSGSRSLARVQSAFNPAIELVFDVALVVVLYFGGRMVVGQELPLDKLVVFARALDQLVWPMAAVGWLTNILQRGAAAHQRLEEVLREADDPAFRPVPATAAAGGELSGAIAARSLTFRYPVAPPERAPALEDVSFEVPAGALVAVVGPVGSGKSTLLSLVARLYDPPAGTLFLDEQDVLSVPIARLRRSIALVPQDTFLFSATIEENVKLGRQAELGRESVEAALRAAQVDGEVRSLPGGETALLGERGVNLSGGQRQRIAIARALVRRPRILLLDDALSAVDTHTESALFGEIQAASSDGRPPTRLVATHRLAMARAADLVLVLEKGRIVERGTHAALVSRGGLYARLARRDALAEELARV
jgi:ATP-binding cassette subfamily B protein